MDLKGVRILIDSLNYVFRLEFTWLIDPTTFMGVIIFESRRSRESFLRDDSMKFLTRSEEFSDKLSYINSAKFIVDFICLEKSLWDFSTRFTKLFKRLLWAKVPNEDLDIMLEFVEKEYLLYWRQNALRVFKVKVQLSEKDEFE